MRPLLAAEERSIGRGSVFCKKKGRPRGGPLTRHTHSVYLCCSEHKKERGVNPPETALGLASVREKRRGPPSYPGASLVLVHNYLYATHIS
jgi:hypothetical protein